MGNRLQYLFLPLLWLLIIGSVGALATGELPTAENRELTAVRGIPMEGTLSASSPDGGELRFFVTTSPIKGTLVLREDGSFTYTSRDGARGRDYFGYRVEGASGVQSQEATVIIHIQKQTAQSLRSRFASSGSAWVISVR